MASPRIVGTILAGGLARRMGGGDKPLLPLLGRPVLAHVIDRVAPQLAALSVNANGDPARFAPFGLPVLPDPVPGQPGPLAGILAGLIWAEEQGAEWLLSVPGDCPFLPPDLVARLHARAGGRGCAMAASAGQAHPVVALWSTAHRAPLDAALAGGLRKVGAYVPDAARVSWSVRPIDPFLNVNTPADLARAARLTPSPPDAPPGGTPARPPG